MPTAPPPERHRTWLHWPASTQHTPRAPVLLLHGFLDAASSWDLVAPQLAAHGHPVYALDLRGHGQGHRAARGDYYHFADYLLDLEALAEEVPELRGPHVLVGHSLGGVLGTFYAGTFPERISHFVNIEGLGPPEQDPFPTPQRMRQFVQEAHKVAHAAPPKPMSRREALRRLELSHPRVPPAVLATRLDGLLEPLGEDAFRWRYDPLHRTRGPYPFRAATFAAFAAQIRARVLYVTGGQHGFRVDGEAQRLTAFASLRQLDFEGAGHMVHWTEPDALAQAILEHAAR